MHFKRLINKSLKQWKANPKRKPLLLRGARQVGKTTLVNSFSQGYDYFIPLNLERAADLRYFQDFTDVKTLVDALFLANNIRTNAMSKVLLFIDEIQESPEAIALLRYFYEDLPQLHVIAAGSLLEHVMDKVKSFPVGRVSYLYLHPLNFVEYLNAKQQSLALEALHEIPVKDFAHQTLKDLFHQYAIIGGMPEVIDTFLETDNVADLPEVYESIWATYKDDVEKYANNATDARVIRHIMNTAHLYLDERIKFQNFGNSNYKSREVGEAMRNLNDARIIQLIYPTTSIASPIKSDLKKSPRLQFLDTGLVNYELNIQGDMLTLEDLSNAYKGAIIPHLITQELMSLNTITYSKPNFWVREKKQASSEVDLVMPYKEKLIPIEIKSGKEGKLKSLHQYIDRADHPYAIRMYSGEFSIEQHSTPMGKKPYLLMNLPYYLGTKLEDYIAYFINNYSIN
ncbi:AAA family ATPase [Winogradskyella sp. J14-2]|uniref:ATP-binding protein n=1 Tax=Winogradskyella sp. J14-2 TaxID=1936080 RepID=UPI0009729371|nr:AAA family ATPase [Winogradskyella sp. J14-2]APY08322.1 AAA family ATPase [Winogradskyella sp. J14-2]